MTTVRQINNSFPIAYPYAVLLFKDGTFMPPTVPRAQRYSKTQELGPLPYGEIVRMAKGSSRGLGRGKKTIMGVFCLFTGEFQTPKPYAIDTDSFLDGIHAWMDQENK